MNDRLAFIDWMKVIGMGLIVWGHTGSDALIRPTEPFNPKQLGVAFFVFVLGFSLAREKRPRMRVVFNRLFPIYAVGVTIAVLLSVIDWVRVGDLRESDYLPLAFGVNVLFNFFPANPTTWFIGTYTHIVVLWALWLYRFRFSRVSLLLIMVLEVGIRACLMKFAGDFVAYMLLTNWMTAFALGLYCGDQSEKRTPSVTRSLTVLGAALGFIAVWTMLSGQLVLQDGFPFQQFSIANETASLLVTSLAVSLLYAFITYLIFRGTEGLPNHRFVQFLARNTLFVFIVHMPLIYALTPVYYPVVPSLVARIVINQFLFFVIPAVVSEYLFRTINLKELRDASFQKLQSWFPLGREHALQHD